MEDINVAKKGERVLRNVLIIKEDCPQVSKQEKHKNNLL